MKRILLFILFFLLLTIPVVLASRKIQHRHRKWLIALRLSALLILLLIFFNPLKGWLPATKTPQPSLPVLDIFLDRSPSMEINNNIKWVQEWLSTNLRGLQEENFIRLYSFSSAVNRTFQLNPSFFKTRGNQTNLKLPLETALKCDPPPEKILLISDGIDTRAAGSGQQAAGSRQRVARNGGLNVLSKTLEKEDVSLFILDVNDKLLPDLQLEEVIVKGGAEKLVGQPVELEIHLNHTGLSHPGIKLSLQKDGELLKTVKREMDLNRQSQTINFPFTPQKVGIYTCKIVGETQDKESTLKNNIAVFFLKVIPKRKIRVGLFADGLDWDYTFIKRALEKDESIQLESVIRTSPTNIYHQGIPAGDGRELKEAYSRRKEGLFKYDVVILDNPVSENFDKEKYTNTLAFVKKRGGGLLIIGGEQLFAEHDFWSEQLERILPVKFCVDPAEALVEKSFIPQITPAGKSSKLFSSWKDNRLPELSDFIKPAEVKPSAKILLTNPGEKSPLLIVSRVGAGKTAVLLSHSTWKWSFRFNRKEKKFYARFWKDFVFWLGEEALKAKNIKLVTDKIVYCPGEKVRLTAYIFDKTYSSLENIKPVIEVVNVGDDGSVVPSIGRTFTPLDNFVSNGAGRFSPTKLEKEFEVWKAIYSPDEEGKYILNLKVFQEDDLIGSDRTGFLVSQPDEFGFYPAGTDLLKRLAGRNYYPKSRAPELIEKLVRPARKPGLFSKEGIKRVPSPVWKRFLNTTVLFILFLGLIFLEWWLRRQEGLP